MIPAPAFILVEPIEDSHKVLSMKSDTPSKKAKVLAVGKPIIRNGTEFNSPVVEGDFILHTAFNYQDFEHEGKQYRVVRFDDVLVVL